MDGPSIKLVANEEDDHLQNAEQCESQLEPVSNFQLASSKPGSPKADVEIERCEPVHRVSEEMKFAAIRVDDDVADKIEDKEDEIERCELVHRVSEEMNSAAIRVDDVVDNRIEDKEDELRTIAETDNCVHVPESDYQNSLFEDDDVLTDVNEEDHTPNLENSILVTKLEVLEPKDGDIDVTNDKTEENSFATGSQLGKESEFTAEKVVEEAHMEIYELKDSQLVAEVAKEGNFENMIVEETKENENEDMGSKENNVNGISEDFVEDVNVENMIVEEQETPTTKKDDFKLRNESEFPTEKENIVDAIVEEVVEEAHMEISESQDSQLIAEVAKEGDVENTIVEETKEDKNEDMGSKEKNVDGIIKEQESQLIKKDVKDGNIENMIGEEQETPTTKKDENEDVVSKEHETVIADTEMETKTEVVRKRGEKNSNIVDRKIRKSIGEDVCFICYNGGDLVLCDRKRCPKAYHPSCVGRDYAFVQSKGSWNCAWHLCSMCKEDAQYICYTCTYSLCKKCMKDGAISRVRNNKGFCETCMKTVMMIERNESGNGEMAKVDFDDKSSWEYLFKDYWSNLKGKLSLSFAGAIQTKIPKKGSDVALGDKHGSPDGNEDGSCSDIPSGKKTCTLLKRKAKKRIKALTKEETSASASHGALGDKQGSPVERCDGNEDGSGPDIPSGNRTCTPIKRKAKKRTKAITKEETSASASNVALRYKQESPIELYDANGGSGLDIPSGNKTITPKKRKAKKRTKAITKEETSASASDVALRDKQESPVERYDANGGFCLDIPSGNKTSTPKKRKAKKRIKPLTEETSASANVVALVDKHGSPVELYDASGDGSGLDIPSGNKTTTPVKRKVKNSTKALIKEEISASASDAALRDKQRFPVELNGANGDGPGSGSDIPSGNKTDTPIKGKAKRRVKDPTNEEIFASASGNLNSIKSKRAKSKKRLKLSAERDSPSGVSAVSVEGTSMFGKSKWASKEVLEFVMHMKDGDASVISQSEVLGLLLKYIKQNKLRDLRRKSQINCDSTLQNLFGKQRVGHFEMLKLLESHFLGRQNSQTYDREGTVNTETSQLVMKDRKLKAQRKGDERVLQSNVDNYVAIDTNNINLVYLTRNVMEALLEDSKYFHRKVVGCFVRIRILGDNQKQEMYRLVQVVGTRKADMAYNVVKRTTDIMLKVQNLNKKEEISIDIISNQEFTEDECYRLRQSIKCGLINPLTLGDILEKVIALQEARDNDWLEAEVERLSHLCDRASDTGRQNEHREYVEKLKHLKSPEERQRRLKKMPKVLSDPSMDPDHESEEDEGELDDNSMTPISNDSSNRKLELISPHKGRCVSNYSCSAMRNSSNTVELSRNVSNKTEDTAVASDIVSENMLAQTKATAKFKDTDKMWLYRDPSGKVQGPFSKVQLRKWSSTGYFPKDLRIWNNIENQDDSILLTFALDRGFEKVIENGFSNHQCAQTSLASYSGKIESSKGTLGMSVEALRFGTNWIEI